MKSVIKDKRLMHLIDSAEQVFFEKGYAKTSVSDICKIAGCSRTTLYSHFDNKENIYLAVVNKSFKKFLGYFSALDIQEKLGINRILAFSQGYLNFSKQYPPHYQMILDFYSILKNNGNKALQSESYRLLTQCAYFEIAQKNAKRPFDLLIQEIKKGQEDGSIVASAAPQTLFLNIWAYLIGVTNLTNSTEQQQVMNILGVKIQDWEANTLSVIERMLTSADA